MSRRSARQFGALLIGSFIGAASCGSSAETSVNVAGPSEVRCRATLGSGTPSFGASGGNGSIAVSIARECPWTAISNAPWIVFTSAREGQGEGTVAYRVVENGDPIARRGAISVGEQSVQVAQEPAPCRFGVTAGEVTAPAGGADLSIEVRTHSACRWTAVPGAEWVAPSPTSGSGDAVVRVQVAVNTGPRRSTDLTVAGRQVTLTQEAVAAPPTPPPAPAPAPTPAPEPTPSPTPPPAPPPAQCTFRLTPSSATFEATGGQDEVRVQTAAGCSWNAQSNAAWVTISLPSSGLGSGEIKYAVAENFSTSTRIALITVGSVTHRVTQEEAQEIRLNGRLSALSGVCPNLRFVVRSQIVKTDRNTDFRRGNCSDIRHDSDVEVRGFREPDGTLLARRVELDKDDDDD